MKTKASFAKSLILVVLLLASGSALAQTASGVINGTLINISGISIVFNTNAAGVALGGSGSGSASANFGIISAFGPLSPGVTRPAVTAGSFTVRTPFNVRVNQGGSPSPNYTLRASLAAAAPVGLAYKIDAVNLTVAAQTVQANGAYKSDVAHNLDLVVSTAAPGAGGPAVGAPLSSTVNFTATAN